MPRHFLTPRRVFLYGPFYLLYLVLKAWPLCGVLGWFPKRRQEVLLAEGVGLIPRAACAHLHGPSTSRASGRGVPRDLLGVPRNLLGVPEGRGRAGPPAPALTPHGASWADPTHAAAQH